MVVFEFVVRIRLLGPETTEWRVVSAKAEACKKANKSSSIEEGLISSKHLYLGNMFSSSLLCQKRWMHIRIMCHAALAQSSTGHGFSSLLRLPTRCGFNGDRATTVH
jgi:hypothetical protein